MIIKRSEMRMMPHNACDVMPSMNDGELNCMVNEKLRHVTGMIAKLL